MSPDDIASVVDHLSSGLSVLERQERLTALDVSIKTTLSVLQKEMQVKLRVAERLPQWSETTAARLALRMAN